MIKLRTAVRVSFILGMLSMFALLTSYLALTDIRRREMGLSFEWQVLEISFALIVAFQISALFTLRRVLLSIKRLMAADGRTAPWSPRDIHGVHRPKKPAAMQPARVPEPRVHCEKASA